MKRIVLPVICVLSLAACQSAPKKAPAPKAEPIEITGSVSSTMTTTPMVPSDPRVTVFPLEGPVENPLTVNRARGVLDNTTAGGYTVFDDSVTVYALPGENVPAYMPNYAVPPLAGQDVAEPAGGGVAGAGVASGRPLGLSSASGLLPPVPNVEVRSADPYANPPVPGMYTKSALAAGARQPLTLTAPEPLSMQPPSEARAPMASPFESARPEAAPRRPMLTGTDDAVAPVVAAGVPVVRSGVAGVGSTATSVAAPQMSPGRRSGPSLTGY